MAQMKRKGNLKLLISISHGFCIFLSFLTHFFFGIFPAAYFCVPCAIAAHFDYENKMTHELSAHENQFVLAICCANKPSR